MGVPVVATGTERARQTNQIAASQGGFEEGEAQKKAHFPVPPPLPAQARLLRAPTPRTDFSRRGWLTTATIYRLCLRHPACSRSQRRSPLPCPCPSQQRSRLHLSAKSSPPLGKFFPYTSLISSASSLRRQHAFCLSPQYVLNFCPSAFFARQSRIKPPKRSR